MVTVWHESWTKQANFLHFLHDWLIRLFSLIFPFKFVDSRLNADIILRFSFKKSLTPRQLARYLQRN
jgi:hypothetical protein